MSDPDPRALTELVADLVRIDSVNPTLVPGGAGEAQIAGYIARWLERADLEVTVEPLGGRPSVVAVARGSGGGPTLLIDGHTDTVGVGRMVSAHEPRVEGARLFGRGAYDMKGGLAAAMLAVASLQGLAGDVVLAAVSDEEAGGTGTRALLESGLRFDAAIVAEPTDLEVGVAHRGYVAFELETAGVAAHGSRADVGIDAITRMGPVLTELHDLDLRLRRGPGHPLLGTGSVHAGRIHGGQEVSTYPSSCVLEGEWRTVPHDQPQAELGALADRTGAELRVTHTGEPFAVAVDDPFVDLVRRRADAPLTAQPYWADSALLAAHGTTTILFGPAGAGAHADEEWVDLPSVARVRDLLISVAHEFCGHGSPT